MNRFLFIFLLSFLVIKVVNAQTTITLQPDAATGQDSRVWSINPTTPYPDNPEFIAAHWTFSGDPGTYRSLIDFDLTSIPVNATIVDAKLSLYYSTGSGSAGQAGANTALLQRIITNWDESSVTWDNQPNVTTANQVTLSETTSSSQSYPDIDVTQLVQDMIDNSGNSYGFMLRLETEAGLASMKFASSDYSNASMHPKLEITYLADTLASDSCFTLIPGPTDGIDAYIWSINPDNNYGDIDDYIAAQWTWGGNEGTLRSVMKFDLSAVPADATIQYAKLSLYYNPTSTTNGQAGDNATYLQRIVTPWDEYNVTWSNQPSVTTSNQVTLNTSTSLSQDYLNTDVTQLVQDMIDDPSNSFGFLMKLVTEETYSSMKFASSDYSDPNKRPRLEVCYNVPTSIISAKSFDFSVYPTTAQKIIHITNPKSFVNCRVDIIDAFGRKVISKEISQVQNNFDMDVSELTTGNYFVRLTSNYGSETRKFVIAR